MGVERKGIHIILVLKLYSASILYISNITQPKLLFNRGLKIFASSVQRSSFEMYTSKMYEREEIIYFYLLPRQLSVDGAFSARCGRGFSDAILFHVPFLMLIIFKCVYCCSLYFINLNLYNFIYVNVSIVFRIFHARRMSTFYFCS